MSNKTITKQPPVSQRQKYLDQFDILNAAGVGVIVTRTREPHRCAEALKEYAHRKKQQFRIWNCVVGWQQFESGKTKDAKPDGIVDIYQAMRRIDDLDGDGKDAWDKSVLVVHYPHWLLPQYFPLIQLLKEYARKFTTTYQRVILLCPEGTNLPRELENDIPFLDFELPGREELRTVYEGVLESIKENGGGTMNPLKKDEVDGLLASGSGMTEYEFESALSQAAIFHRPKWPNVSFNDLNTLLLQSKTEVIKRSEVLELMTPCAIEDVGGMDLLKEWIIRRAGCFTPEAIEFGVDTPKGIILIGVPGTGKTLGGKAISSVLKMPLIRFDVGKVYGSLVGESEQRVRSALKQLDACAPCVALIDEVDKAGLDPRQSGGDGGTSKRVMGAILTHLQESTAPIVWILTANRVDSLPPELLRKGRLDEVWAVMPPNTAEREAVLKIHLRKRKQNPDSIDLTKAIQASDGFVSAELEAAVKEAVVDAYSTGAKVTGELIARQLVGMTPISEAFAEDFNRMKDWAKKNARPASKSEMELLPDGGGGITRKRRTRAVGGAE